MQQSLPKIQTIEVQSENTGSAGIKAPASLKAGKTKKLYVVKKITYPGIMGGKNTTEGILLKNIKWSSSKSSVLSVDANGTLKAKKVGKATITAKISGGKNLKATIKVK